MVGPLDGDGLPGAAALAVRVGVGAEVVAGAGHGRGEQDSLRLPEQNNNKSSFGDSWLVMGRIRFPDDTDVCGMIIYYRSFKLIDF